MGLYRQIRLQLGVPVKIALYVYKDGGMRPETGFRENEFDDLETVYVGKNFDAGKALMDECRGFNHIFTIFQRAPTYRRLILEAIKRHDRVAIAAESPCNMDYGIRWILKELYDRIYLPFYSREIVRGCDFFVNYSGSDKTTAKAIGWNAEKIVPFGYYPPPLDNSKCVKRTSNEKFEILATGILSRYRGADVLVDALVALKNRGVRYHATITQEGELLPQLKKIARKYQLPISFPGFVKISDLVKLYETCSVYVGAGRREPWGMRLNDALNCGSPLVVSRGMGGVRLVNEYGCGLAFDSGDSVGLAAVLERLATDASLYAYCSGRAITAASDNSPKKQASVFIEAMGRFGDEWRAGNAFDK